MNRREIDAVERDDVTRKEMMDALQPVLPAQTDERQLSENREPTCEERDVRYRLERRRRRVTLRILLRHSPLDADGQADPSKSLTPHLPALANNRPCAAFHGGCIHQQ